MFVTLLRLSACRVLGNFKVIGSTVGVRTIGAVLIVMGGTNMGGEGAGIV